MKQFFSLVLTMYLLLFVFCLPTFAEAEQPGSIEVYVTVADKGMLVMPQEKVTVTDMDGDGTLTINDALFCAHEAKYDGGAVAGYAYYNHETFGISLGMLWGDNSGAYGYYLNHASAMSLADRVSDGDFVNAFVYKNSDYSDMYCFFDKNTLTAKEGDEITLKLQYAGYDAEWNPVVLPVEGATVTIDGVATAFQTDAEGMVTVKLEAAGNLLIGAVSDTVTLVPPTCRATVEAKDTGNTDPADAASSGCNSVISVSGMTLMSVLGMLGMAWTFKKNEK